MKMILRISFILVLSTHSIKTTIGQERWTLLEKDVLGVEDVYLDVKNFNENNSKSGDQLYVVIMHSYKSLKKGIEHFDGNFATIFIDETKPHQSVVNVEVLECSKSRSATIQTEWYSGKMPSGRPIAMENYENDPVTLGFISPYYNRICNLQSSLMN